MWWTLLNSYVTTWLIPLLMVVGILGNAVCLVVLCRHQPLPRDVQIWFCAQCCIGLYIMMLCATDFYIMAVFGVYVSNISKSLCYVSQSVNYTGFFMVSWLQTGISVLRAIATASSLRCHGLISRQKSKTALISLCATAIVIATLLVGIFAQFTAATSTLSSVIASVNQTNINVNVLTTHVSSFVLMTDSIKWQCQMSLSFTYIEFVIRDCLPILVMSFSSILVLAQLKETVRYGQRRKSRQRRTTITLLWMNLSYLICQTPLNIFQMTLNNFSNIQLDSDVYHTVLLVIHYVMYIEFSFNWTFLLLLGERFRQDLRRVLSSSSMTQRFYPYTPTPPCHLRFHRNYHINGEGCRGVDQSSSKTSHNGGGNHFELLNVHSKSRSSSPMKRSNHSYKRVTFA